MQIILTRKERRVIETMFIAATTAVMCQPCSLQQEITNAGGTYEEDSVMGTTLIEFPEVRVALFLEFTTELIDLVGNSIKQMFGFFKVLEAAVKGLETKYHSRFKELDDDSKPMQ